MRFAVADVGTNSTHLLIAEANGGSYHVLDALKVRTRLGECLDEHGYMTAEGEQRLTEALQHFAELTRSLGVPNVRIYATSALREAPNGAEIAERVLENVGLYPVIISGEREGRLTYLGAMHSVDFGDDNLLLDLGGGSIELVRGDQTEVKDVVSLPLGGIRMTNRFLHKDPPKGSEFKELVAYLTGALEPYQQRFAANADTKVFFSSGTAEDLALALAAAQGEAPSQSNGLVILRREAGELLERLRKMTEQERSKIPAFEKRARIIVAAVAVLHTAMQVLNINEATISEGALREGMLVEELRQHEDYQDGLSARHRSALALAERYCVDLSHATHTSLLAKQMYNLMQQAGADLPERGRSLLRAAAVLHESGRLVNQSGSHKHSAYLIRHGGLLGYSEQEIELIAQIARYYRGALPRETHPEYMALSAEDQRLLRQMAAILRVASGLNRSYGGVSAIKDLSMNKKSGAWRMVAVAPSALDRSGAAEKADLWEREFGALEFVWRDESDEDGQQRG